MKYVVFSEKQVDDAAEYMASCFHHAGFMMRRELGDPVAEFEAPSTRKVRTIIKKGTRIDR